MRETSPTWHRLLPVQFYGFVSTSIVNQFLCVKLKTTTIYCGYIASQDKSQLHRLHGRFQKTLLLAECGPDCTAVYDGERFFTQLCACVKNQ